MKSSLFNILGPVMIGPSSSHTAGAARLGRAAYMMLGKPPRKVRFTLHGSFAETYRGHGTDRALVAGLLGMQPYDEGLRSSLEMAKSQGIEVEFVPGDLGEVHPNTVLIEMIDDQGKEHKMMGSSIGGGNVQILQVDSAKADFSGEYPVILTTHRDQVGALSHITQVLAEQGVNIVTLRLTREKRGDLAFAIIETDTLAEASALKAIEDLDEVLAVTSMEKLL